MSNLSLFLFGSPRIERDGKTIQIERYHQNAIALLAYLTISETEQHRDTLATLFWPALGRGRARAALSNLLWVLNRTFAKGWLQDERGMLRLNRDAGLWIDVDQFQTLLKRYRAHSHPPEQTSAADLTALTEAIELYRADFLAGFNQPDNPQFDDWQRLQTERLQRELASTLEELVCRYTAQPAFDQAIVYARRWLALEPLHEPAHRRLMQLYAWNDQRADALRQYQVCEQVLREQLGICLQEATVQVYRDIQENRLPPRTVDSDPQLVPRCPHNLPVQPTPFVGRERELADIARFLDDPGSRLLTLVGPGGIGKTRLAIQGALQGTVEKTTTFSDGFWFVPLVALESSHLLSLTIADALECSFYGDVNLGLQLSNHLRDKKMILVLDNLEHLVKDTDLLLKILNTAPGVKLLVTSREHLNIKWEQSLKVGGLNFPRDDQVTTIEDYSAVQMFLQSARRVHPGFIFSEEEKPCVVRICQFLEGMPLGIELAAGWVPVLSCREIAEEIERNLAFLTTMFKDVPERHTSLHAVFDHSWKQITKQERDVLSKLSVFCGGFRREAAERVADASLLLLLACTNKSFLRRNATGRYEILEVLRQYVEEKLEQRAATRDRHCEYYAEFIHRREAQLTGEKLKKALKEISEEIENVRAAWEWAVARNKIDTISQFLVGFYTFYFLQGWFQEGEKAMATAFKALDSLDGPPSQVAAQEATLMGRILTLQGVFCLNLGRYQEARALLQHSLQVLYRAGERHEMAFSIANLGTVAEMSDKAAQARRMYQKSLTAFQSSEIPRGIAYCLRRLGVIACKQGQYTEAWRLFQKALAIWQEVGNQAGIARCLGNLGLLAETLSDYAEAKRLHLESVNLYQELGLQWETANSYINLGFTLCELKEHAQAKKYFEQALETAIDTRTLPMVLEALLGIAVLLMHKGEKEQAWELVYHILDHPAVYWEITSRAKRLIAEWESQLCPQTIAAAKSKVKAKDLKIFLLISKPVEQIEPLCSIL